MLTIAIPKNLTHVINSSYFEHIAQLLFFSGNYLSYGRGVQAVKVTNLETIITIANIIIRMFMILVNGSVLFIFFLPSSFPFSSSFSTQFLNQFQCRTQKISSQKVSTKLNWSIFQFLYREMLCDCIQTMADLIVQFITQ